MDGFGDWSLRLRGFFGYSQHGDWLLRLGRHSFDVHGSHNILKELEDTIQGRFMPFELENTTTTKIRKRGGVLRKKI